MMARKALKDNRVLKTSNTWSRAVADFLEDEDSSRAAQSFQNFMTAFNVAAICIALLDSVDVLLFGPFSAAASVGIDSWLFCESFLRFLFTPNCRHFFKDPLNIIDACSLVPLVVRGIKDNYGAHFSDTAGNFLLAIVPVVRLLRLVRRFPHMQLLVSAFRDCFEALPVLLYTMAVLGCFFSTMIFLAEPRDNVESMSQSAWLVISTMTTVGYGDIVPCSNLGSFLVSILMIVSSLYMAMPVAIIGYQFTNIWGNRSQIMLLQNARDRLSRCGIGPYEMPTIFSLFDFDASQEIDMEEFHRMLEEIEVGLREEETSHLFKIIDTNMGGTIDLRELVKTLYPEDYRKMFRKRGRTHRSTTHGHTV